MCAHTPDCPSATADNACSAQVTRPHHDQGWSLLCNGAILFDDGGLIRPDGSVKRPNRTDTGGRTTALAR